MEYMLLVVRGEKLPTLPWPPMAKKIGGVGASILSGLGRDDTWYGVGGC